MDCCSTEELWWHQRKTLVQFIHVIGIPRCNIYCILKVMLFNNEWFYRLFQSLYHVLTASPLYLLVPFAPHDFLFYFSTSTHVFHSSFVSWTRCSWPVLKLTFFFFLDKTVKLCGKWCWNLEELRSTLILILTTAGFNKIVFPFLQLQSLILHKYLWSPEYIITSAYCYVCVCVCVHFLGLYTFL